MGKIRRLEGDRRMARHPGGPPVGQGGLCKCSLVALGELGSGLTNMALQRMAPWGQAFQPVLPIFRPCVAKLHEHAKVTNESVGEPRPKPTFRLKLNWRASIVIRAVS